MLLGTIQAFGGPLTDENLARLDQIGWMLCDGSKLEREEYKELYEIIGDFWGAGDRIKTFHIPDLRGQFLRGVTHDTKNDPDVTSRTASTPSNPPEFRNNVGSYQLDDLKSHGHGVSVSAPGAQNDFLGGSTAAYGIDPNFNSNHRIENIVGPSGGSESRPRNAYVEWIIKVKITR